ncbi:hypothetical protein CLOM621_07353 [Clostridium sp. M62/1]|uniref:hypothetical protein n=1 Tax=Clostridium sp. M62/1 TaxID=411486 RepID=UPI0001973362|nr:hypothetical protein [Clostridium sp. M62/1]EFE12395.1 hypothetical protein CLOM621_07353 [Clostridium sp. M62/1]
MPGDLPFARGKLTNRNAKTVKDDKEPTEKTAGELRKKFCSKNFGMGNPRKQPKNAGKNTGFYCNKKMFLLAFMDF